MTAKKEEVLEKVLKTKKVFHFIDSENEIDQISREVFKKKDEEVHYPRGFEGGHKYKTIRKIRFIGFKGNIPVGMIKSVFYGYGFTKTLGPFARYIDDNYRFKEVVVEKGGETRIDEPHKTLYINEADLKSLNSGFSTVFAKNRAEVQAILERMAHSLFPAQVKEPTAKYIKNALSQSLAAWGNSIEEFSDEDKKAISELFESLSSGTDFLSTDSLKATKEIVDTRLVDKALAAFDKLYEQTSDTSTLEKKWQGFLKDNAWIFSSIFAQPVILFEDEAYAGGKSLNNKGGKFTDFLVKNKLSDNISFFEIKTHKTPLLAKSVYRGNDVYSTTKHLSGCVNQVLNQRDKFQKTFANLKLESDDEFETINSSCFVLIGSLNALGKKQRYSFELFRSNSRDVNVITFDEVREKIQLLKTVLGTEVRDG